MQWRERGERRVKRFIERVGNVLFRMILGMKKLDYFLFALAFVAIGVLYVLHFKGEKKDAPEIEACVVEEKVDTSLKIAYVNADSLLMNYKYAIELN
ncbi:MAG TPA: hypothetical protein DDY68_00375, partial [Porphyromonadaceae bacterium]|nr:hypothetical protein [Porphyromonadaceae bacterium]